MARRGGKWAVSARATRDKHVATLFPLGHPCRVFSSTCALHLLSRVQTTSPGASHFPLPQDLPGSSPHTLGVSLLQPTASGDIFAANVLKSWLCSLPLIASWTGLWPCGSTEPMWLSLATLVRLHFLLLRSVFLTCDILSWFLSCILTSPNFQISFFFFWSFAISPLFLSLYKRRSFNF